MIAIAITNVVIPISIPIHPVTVATTIVDNIFIANATVLIIFGVVVILYCYSQHYKYSYSSCY